MEQDKLVVACGPIYAELDRMLRERRELIGKLVPLNQRVGSLLASLKAITGIESVIDNSGVRK